MSYYTKFSMVVFDAKTANLVSKDLEKEIALIINEKYLYSCTDSDILKNEDNFPLNLLFEEDLKWYSCEEDLKELSYLYPNLIFCVDGEGEERDDIWEMVIRKGLVKKVYCRIVYPDIPLTEFLDTPLIVCPDIPLTEFLDN